MTTSARDAYDARLAGHAVDGDLLHELARDGVDPAEARLAAAELSGLGAIHGKAFEQITNNFNFKGSDEPLAGRLAFALAVESNGGSAALEKYWNVVLRKSGPVRPLSELHSALSLTTPPAAWTQRALDDATRLLQDTSSQDLLSSPTFATILRGRLEAAGDLPTGLEDVGPRGLIAYQLSRAGGVNSADSVAIALRAHDGLVDIPTLKTLASAKSGEPVYLTERRGKSADLGPIDYATALDVSESVARGELSLGQLFGFYQTYGRSDEYPMQVLNFRDAVAVLQMVNSGEIDPSRLDKVLRPQTYISASFRDKIWDRLFSAKSDGVHWSDGCKYTTSGVRPDSLVTAPVTKRLTATLVLQLTHDDQALGKFVSSFQSALTSLLPSSKSVAERNKTDHSRWEIGLYDQLVEKAFNKALAQISFE